MSNINDDPSPTMQSDSNKNISLDARIQALPQELQDMILLLTDAFDIPAIVTIDEVREHEFRGSWNLLSFHNSYKPPVALQLNRRIRADFAREYYGSVIFECQTRRFGDLGIHDELVEPPQPGPDPWARLHWTSISNGSRHLTAWLSTLEEQHIRMIRTIQLSATEPRRSDKLMPRHLYRDTVNLKRLMEIEIGPSVGQAQLVLTCDSSMNGEGAKIQKRRFDIDGNRIVG